MLHRAFYNKPEEFYKSYFFNPLHISGIVVASGTTANITALWIARNKSLGPRDDFRGVHVEGMPAALKHYGYKDSVILVSSFAHYSFAKAASMLGLGKKNIITLDIDANYSVDIDKLRKKVIDLQNNNIQILAIVGIAGGTECGNLDNLEALGQIAEEFKIHFHADAAFGGSFVLSDNYSSKLKGIEQADTITLCAHKQLYVPMGMSMVLLKTPSDGEYILTTQPILNLKELEGEVPLFLLHPGTGGAEGYRDFAMLFNGAKKN